MAKEKYEPNVLLREKIEWLIEKKAYKDLAEVAEDFDRVLHEMGHIKDTDDHFTAKMLGEVIAGKRKLSQIFEYRLAEILGEDADQVGFE